MKPQLKREVAVTFFNNQVRIIRVNASKDAIEDFRGFGSIYIEDEKSGKCDLFVDGRYDFDEVLTYIQNYGNEEK